MESTRVYVTVGKSRVYHSSLRCEYARASALVKPRDLRGTDLRRCTGCWGHLKGFDLLVHETERVGDSSYEVDFVEQVLREVRGLQAQDVTPQKEFGLSGGVKRRVDFYIDRGGRPGLVIELDGFDKSQKLTPQEVHQQDKAKRRAIEAQHPVEFVDFAVLDLSIPQQAIKDIECLLRPDPDSGADSADIPKSAGAPEPSRVTDMSEPRRTRSPVAALAAVAATVLLGLAGWWLLSDRDNGLDPLSDGRCPTSAPIKGNVSAGGEKIFHAPGWEYYERTAAEECFESQEAAVDAGYRASEVQ